LPSIENKEMNFYAWSSNDPLIDAPFDTKIPDPNHSMIVTPDILLCPLLAFD